MKFGKSEQGNIWLSAERTPVFEFYQFWRNVADADVATFLARFTFLPMDDVRRLTAAGGAALNEAKTVLAQEVTTLIHGAEAAAQATKLRNKLSAAALSATCAATACRMRRLLAANSKRVLVY